MKMDILFRSMESSFHPCRAQVLFSTSEEIGTAHLLSTYMKKPNSYKDNPGITTTAIHCLRGKNYSIFSKNEIFHRDACIRKEVHNGDCVQFTSKTGSYV